VSRGGSASARTRYRSRGDARMRGAVPAPSSAAVKRRMQTQRREGTACEIAVRRLLYHAGARYTTHRRPVPRLRRRADIVFVGPRVAVFVDGCFWHWCPTHSPKVKAHRSWWRAKLLANVRRDRDTDKQLGLAGWRVVRVWEHENPEAAARRILRAVKLASSALLTRGRP
jgi:DNA mismatch endonuclease (patch repair protein)